MNVTLSNDNYVQVEPNSVVLTPDESLKIDFITHYDLSNGIVSLKNGDKTEILHFSKSLLIPQELALTGQLSIAIDMYLNGEIVKHWDIMPIKIVVAENTSKVWSEFEDLKNRVQSLEDKHKITK